MKQRLFSDNTQLPRLRATGDTTFSTAEWDALVSLASVWNKCYPPADSDKEVCLSITKKWFPTEWVAVCWGKVDFSDAIHKGCPHISVLKKIPTLYNKVVGEDYGRRLRFTCNDKVKRDTLNNLLLAIKELGSDLSGRTEKYSLDPSGEVKKATVGGITATMKIPYSKTEHDKVLAAAKTATEVKREQTAQKREDTVQAAEVANQKVEEQRAAEATVATAQAKSRTGAFRALLIAGGAAVVGAIVFAVVRLTKKQQ